MARSRSFRGRGISQTQRRKKTWVSTVIAAGGAANSPGFNSTVGINIAPNLTPGNNSTAGLILMSGDGTQASPFVGGLPSESTILRMRGSLSFPKNTYDAAGLVNNQFAIGYGVSGISDLNADSYPTPISHADWDGWMFLRQSAINPVDSQGTMVDVKAMRKVQDGDVFFISAETVAGDGTPSATNQQWLLDLRILLLLP